jgi:hypothetical protein
MSRASLRPALGGFLLVAWICASASPFSVRGQERVVSMSDPFFAAVRNNLSRSDREQYRYAYHERRSDVHTNPFGRIGTDGSLLYQVTPGDEYGIYHRLLVERDGKALSNESKETIDRRGRSDTNPAVDDVVATLAFQINGYETSGGRKLMLLGFSPKPDAKPRTRQGKLAKAFKGTIWIDEQAREVVRVEATAIDSISYGLGVVARLSEGTQVKVLREPIDSVWLPTSIRLTGEGRALLFRRLNVDYSVEWFDYKRTQK